MLNVLRKCNSTKRDGDYWLKETISYLQSYTDVNIESLIAMNDNFDCNDVDLLCNYIWSENAIRDEYLPVASVFQTMPWSKNTTKVIENILQKSSGSSVVILKNHKNFEMEQSIIQSVSHMTLKDHVWLLLYPNTDGNLKDTKSYLNESYIRKQENIRLDSQIYILSYNTTVGNLYEIYKVCDEKPFILTHLISFSNESKIIRNEERIWDRRGNLHKCPLRVNYFEDPPWVMLNRFNTNFPYHQYININGTRVYGNEVEIFQTLMDSLNFTIQGVYNEDHQYGKLDLDTNSWNGIIGQLISGEADMSIFQLIVIKSRGLAIDFSTATNDNAFGLYMRKPRQSLSWETFTKVFYYRYWCLLCVIAVLCSVVLWMFFEIFDTNPASPIKQKLLSNIIRNLGSGFSVVGLSFASQDVSLARTQTNHSSLSLRILFFTVCMFGAMNYWAWNAGLISHLTYEGIELPIEKLEDFFSHSDYQIVVLKNAAPESYFSDAEVKDRNGIISDSHRTVLKIWKDKIEGNPNAYVSNSLEEEAAILGDEKKVLFANVLGEPTMANYPCKLMKSVYTYHKTSVAYPFPKNSPHKKVFDKAINRLVETGSISIFEQHKKHLKPIVNCDEDSDWVALGYENILIAFVISGIGLVLAIIYCLLEYVYGLYYPFIHRTMGESSSNGSDKGKYYRIEQKVLDMAKLVQEIDEDSLQNYKSYYVDILTELSLKLKYEISQNITTYN